MGALPRLGRLEQEPTEADPVPFETQHIDGETRHRYNVNVVRIPAAERDTARTVMPDDDAVTERRYREGLGGDADDDDPAFPVSSRKALTRARKARDAGEAEPWRHLDGAPGWYTLMLSEDEAAELRKASNVIAVTVDARVEHHGPRPIRVDVTPQ